MQLVKCYTSNIETSFLARVSFTQQKKSERHRCAIIRTSNKANNTDEYACQLIAKENENQISNNHNLPTVVFETNEYILKQDDIIRISPNQGEIVMLFESNQKDNCIFVTDRCNSKCIMCPQQPKADREDYTTLNKELISLISTSPEYLTITGGEPTLLGDQLVDLIKECREKLPNTKIMVLTNGRNFVQTPLIESIAKVAGAHVAFAVPLYSDNSLQHDEIVGVPGAFSQTVLACQNLALYGLPVEIRIVVMSLNATRLKNIAEFIYRNLTFAFHVAFMGMELKDLAEKNLEKIWIDPYEYQDSLFQASKYLCQRGLNVSIYNHQLCLLPEELWHLSTKSISRWKNTAMPECSDCSKQEVCGGFFSSSSVRYSQHISPIY